MREGERLVAAAPLYLKAHSYGEFVFDWAWAEAHERAGLRYYPKLIGAVPFTPTSGPRLLVAADTGAAAARAALAGAARELAASLGCSSLHFLFCTEEEARELAGAGFELRTGCQFHWHNPGLASFDDYLAMLDSKHRKQVRRERREAAAAPVEIVRVAGTAASPEQWHAYHRLYRSTYDRKWGYPSLTLEFFETLGRELGDALLLVLARRGGRYVAGAHCLVGSDTLYGRNWGRSEYHRALHFEMCYYRTIEICIERRLKRFDAGAQGEHKLARGFLPTRTWSAHWIAAPRLRRAIAAHLAEEREAVAAYLRDAERHLPFRRAG